MPSWHWSQIHWILQKYAVTLGTPCIIKKKQGDIFMTMHFLQESEGQGCPFCRAEIKGTEGIIVDPFDPHRQHKRNPNGPIQVAHLVDLEDDDEVQNHHDNETLWFVFGASVASTFFLFWPLFGSCCSMNLTIWHSFILSIWQIWFFWAFVVLFWFCGAACSLYDGARQCCLAVVLHETHFDLYLLPLPPHLFFFLACEFFRPCLGHFVYMGRCECSHVDILSCPNCQGSFYFSFCYGLWS